MNTAALVNDNKGKAAIFIDLSMCLLITVALCLHDKIGTFNCINQIDILYEFID